MRFSVWNFRVIVSAAFAVQVGASQFNLRGETTKLPAAKTCEMNTDCSSNLWCKENHVSYCQGFRNRSDGYCPEPHCVLVLGETTEAPSTTESSAPTRPPVAETTAEAQVPTASSTTAEAQVPTTEESTEAPSTTAEAQFPSKRCVVGENPQKQDVDDEKCAACAKGQLWWPCDDAKLCTCSSSSGANPTLETANTTIVSVPEETTEAPSTTVEAQVPTTEETTEAPRTTESSAPSLTTRLPVAETTGEITEKSTLASSTAAAPATNPTTTKVPMTTDPAGDKYIICYFTNWGPDVAQLNIDPQLCTHYMVAFATVTSDFDLTVGEKRGYEGLTVGVKSANSKVKVLISVGGWNFNDCSLAGSATCEIFSNIASSNESIRSFAKNVIKVCRERGFDGLDIDWEYPVLAGHNGWQEQIRDYENYITMLRLMKEEFLGEDPTNPLLLTAAVGVGKKVEESYNIREMSTHLDLINLMTYDLHGWEKNVACHANLNSNNEDIDFDGYPLSVSWAVDYWIAHGASPKKLTMGLATYGRGWKLQDQSKTAYNSKATIYRFQLPYSKIQALLQSGHAKRHYDSIRECPYIVTDGKWFGYDDERSLVAKVDFIKQRELQGAMVWSLEQDDYTGSSSEGIKYPFISTVKSALLGRTSAASSPTRPPVAEITGEPCSSSSCVNPTPKTAAASVCESECKSNGTGDCHVSSWYEKCFFASKGKAGCDYFQGEYCG